MHGVNGIVSNMDETLAAVCTSLGCNDVKDKEINVHCSYGARFRSCTLSLLHAQHNVMQILGSVTKVRDGRYLHYALTFPFILGISAFLRMCRMLTMKIINSLHTQSQADFIGMTLHCL